LLRSLQTTGPASAQHQPRQGGVGLRARQQQPPPPVKKLGCNERVQDARFSTPTVVTPEETLDTPLGQHRKSEWVILEAA